MASKWNIAIGAKLNLKGVTDQLSAAANKATQKISGMAGALSKTAGTAAAATLAGIALAMAGGAAAAVKFENEFANVKKTMNDVEDPKVFEKIQNDLIALSTQIPIMLSELAGIAAVGGQLGIGANDIAQFTEVVAKLGGATNMTSEQAATGMARFLNVTNEQISSIGKFSAVLVELGNSTAATEGEILLLAQNFGATGNIVGLSTQEILAFSAAMKETGQQSQAGATALGKLFMQLSDASKIGGKEMAVFAETAGMDVNEFRRIIETDIGSAAQIFLSGINRMNAQGRSTTETMEDLGLGTIRVQRAILSLANNQEGLTEALSRANKQVITQNALNDEANQKFDTAAMRLTQVKTTINAAAVAFGDALLPAIKGVIGVLQAFADALFGLGKFFGEFPAILAVVSTGLFGIATAAFKASDKTGILAKSIVGLGKAFGKIFTLGGLVVGVLIAIGLAYSKYKDKLENMEEIGKATDDVINKVKINLTKGFDAEPISEDQWTSFLANLPEATRKAVVKGIEEGQMGQEVFDALTSSAPQLGEEFIATFRDAIDKEEGFTSLFSDLNMSGFGATTSGLDDTALLQGLVTDLQAIGNTALNPVIDALKEYASLQGVTGKAARERRKELQELLFVQLQIVESAKNEGSVRDGQISEALNQHFEHVAKIDRRTTSLMRTEAGRLKLARELANGPNGIKKFKDILGDVPPIAEDLNEELEETESNLDVIMRLANDFKTNIDNLFGPIDAQFKAGKTERDLVKAHKEHADLHEEQQDLTQEELDLQQEKLDLANADLATAEEKLEMQELENEALEIEKKIREGMSLSANDQLRKEKLKKDLAKVNAAAAQGSLEFADLERKAIMEQIAEIDGKALTQADADEKRKKSSEIAAEAEQRRLDRQEEVNIRILEIQERLAEIPDEIYDAHYDIHNLQKDMVNNHIAMIEAQAKYNTLKEEELRATAQLFGMNMAQIDGLMTLMNHARVESGPIGQSLIDLVIGNLADLLDIKGYTERNSATGSQGANLIDQWNKASSSYAIMKPTYGLHKGGMFKPGRNYVVGEYGPETLKAFPGGGGMITSMGYGPNNTGGSTNYVTLNVTGLPSDPIAARRTAQLIQKELNKLKSDGRSGIVR